MPPRRVADVTVTTTLDVSGLISRRLNDAERKVFNRHRRGIVAFIRGRWSGWRYEGRPIGAPRNVSQSAWTSTIETTEADAIALVIRNEARDYRTGTKDYVAYVHRSGSSTPEVDAVFDAVRTDYVPKVVTELTAEIQKSLNQPAKRQALRKGGGTVVRAAGLEV